MKVRRVIEYDGTPEWIKRTLEKSITGTYHTGSNNTITEISREEIKEPDHAESHQADEPCDPDLILDSDQMV